MRVLTIVHDLSIGGLQRAAQDYTVGYRRFGCEVAVLALDSGGPRVAVLENAGVPVFVGGPTADEQEAATERAAAWGPDLIHLHNYGPVRPFEGRAVLRLKEATGGEAPVLETTSFGRIDYRCLYTATDVHLLLSKWMLWRWARWARPLSPRPLGTVVPLTVDPDAFYPSSPAESALVRARLGVPQDAFVFGCIARADPVKWPPTVFRAFRAVAQKHPTSYLVVGELTERARGYVRDLPPEVRRRVIEIPLQQGDAALRAFYGAIDVFVHASTMGESFGLVFVEAQACGTPVVTVSTPLKGNSQLEVVGHERGGLIANDYKSMAACMERLFLDDTLRQRLGREGRQYVLAHYTLEQVIPTLLKIAELARTTPTRAALRTAIEADRELVTAVSDLEIASLLRHTTGRRPMWKRLARSIVRTPTFARAYYAVQRRRGLFAVDPPFAGASPPRTEHTALSSGRPV